MLKTVRLSHRFQPIINCCCLEFEWLFISNKLDEGMQVKMGRPLLPSDYCKQSNRRRCYFDSTPLLPCFQCFHCRRGRWAGGRAIEWENDDSNGMPLRPLLSGHKFRIRHDPLFRNEPVNRMSANFSSDFSSDFSSHFSSHLSGIDGRRSGMSIFVCRLRFLLEKDADVFINLLPIDSVGAHFRASYSISSVRGCALDFRPFIAD